MVTPAGSKPFILTRWDNALGEFFHNPKPLTKVANASLPQKALYTGKSAFKDFGFRLNQYTYNAANALGKKMMTAANAGSKAGFFGKLISKSKFLTNLGNGLKGLGPKTKIPGIATLFAVGTGIIGAIKAGKKALTGDFKGAGHELLKTGGSVAGLMASMAVFVPGVNIIAALGLAIGIGMASDWASKKVADTIFPSVAKKEALAKKQAEALRASQQRLGMYG